MKLQKRKYTILDSIRICFEGSPVEAIAIIILTVINAILPYLSVKVNTKFINSALLYVEQRDQLHDILVSIFQLSLIFGYFYFYTILVRILNERISMKMRSQFKETMIERYSRLKFEYIENSETYNLLSRVMESPGPDIIQQGFNRLIAGIGIIINIISVGSLILVISWWTLPILLIFMIPNMIASYRASIDNYTVLRWNSELSRKSNYIEFDMLRGRDPAAERTLFGYTKYFNERFEEYFCQALNMEKKIKLKWLIVMKVAAALIIFSCAAVAFTMLLDLKGGLITIGFFISAVGALFQLQGLMTNRMSELIIQLTETAEYMKDFTSFTHLEEEEDKAGKNTELKVDTIEFKDVYFKYPGTDNYVLKGVSFKIDKGSHFAIVGKNGSGKSTITKLLLRLYQVNSGEILVNGININDFSSQEVYSLFSIVYQDFAKYAIPAKDNIGLGDSEHIGDMERIMLSSEQAGIRRDIEALPSGFDTPLGKVLSDSVDISGGQWQRVALARSLMKEGTVKILDEPTSALDPIEETKLYQKYSEISQNSTTIFISHRLGSTKLADYILLIEEGVVKNCGTHEELIKNDGLYRQMFNTQKEWYDET